jgi:putative ABC transport system ATP-binding protein
MLALKNIVKLYCTESVETRVLDKINIHVKKREFVAIMGQSGCGKSTLLNTIGMLDQPSEGNYYFDGEDVANYSERRLSNVRKSNIGFMFKSFNLINLIDELTVFENIELPLIHQKVAKGERQQRVMEVLEKVGIAHRKDHFPQQLSGGQQQRVAVPMY